MIATESNYLVNLPTDIINDYGLSKTLLTRRETIYLKHILKNIFIYGSEQELEEKLQMLQFKSLFQYFGFITNKLRAIYKLPRNYKIDDANKLVKPRRNNFLRMLEIYKDLKPIIIVDFDKTITNKKFHSLYSYLANDYQVIINSANPMQDVIEKYLETHDLSIPKYIFANKGKKKKIVKLKDIAYNNLDKIIFYIDDEPEYLDYGCLISMYCYEYTKEGKIHNHTIFKK